MTLLLGLLLAAPAMAKTVTPTLWHVKGSGGDVYLLGSVHILPPGVQWRSPAITAATAQADVFVFEVPTDAKAVQQLQALVAANGSLPQGESLRASLHPEAQGDFDTAVAASGLQPAAIDHERPWLAGLQMMFTQIAKQGFDRDNGVDTQLLADANKAGKQTRYLETIDQQFALLAPEDRTLELEEFESGLKDLRDVTAEIQPMVDAWGTGDQEKLGVLVNGDLDEFPAARKALLEDRNARWVPQIEAMLREKHTFFITVGAGHLIGPQGVPALLRKAGYKVDGP
ncbi:MAG TPA: TraB/GumN family protein [Rhizomicrobium sp.]|nr:TraB/GumN family protein [Rhizomicrobium sp.]